ncbi:MAG: DUF4389 domain-containing protein [Gammaproteobacteria bacterium]|nr:DUF4389 domain-containing protein [Gammaproteobacteria bacterium]
MDQQLKSNLLSSAHWIRLLFMLLFALLVQVAAAVMWVVVVVQFLFNLLGGTSNIPLREFGHSLSVFIFQCWQFLNYNADDKPFPFQDWPGDSSD